MEDNSKDVLKRARLMAGAHGKLMAIAVEAGFAAWEKGAKARYSAQLPDSLAPASVPAAVAVLAATIYNEMIGHFDLAERRALED